MSKELQKLLTKERKLATDVDNEGIETVRALLKKDFESNNPGLSMYELAQTILQKQYVTPREKARIKKWVITLKQNSDTTTPIICLHRRYKFASSEDEIIKYNAANMKNGAKKIKISMQRLPQQFKALGIKTSAEEALTRIQQEDMQLSLPNYKQHE